MPDDYHPTCYKCGKPLPLVMRNCTRLRKCEECRQKHRSDHDKERREILKKLRYVTGRKCKRCDEPIPDDSQSYWCNQCRHEAASKQATAVELRKDKTRQEPEPTTALPGTPEKIEVLMQRIAAGKSPWNVNDVGFRGWEYEM